MSWCLVLPGNESFLPLFSLHLHLDEPPRRQLHALSSSSLLSFPSFLRCCASLCVSSSWAGFRWIGSLALGLRDFSDLNLNLNFTSSVVKPRKGTDRLRLLESVIVPSRLISISVRFRFRLRFPHYGFRSGPLPQAGPLHRHPRRDHLRRAWRVCHQGLGRGH